MRREENYTVKRVLSKLPRRRRVLMTEDKRKDTCRREIKMVGLNSDEVMDS